MKRKTRILVVDDNQDLAGNIQEVLAAKGFDVAVAYDAADAVHPRLEIESAPISIDTAIPCGLVLNERVSNAFKHAFADGRKGEIRISLTRNGAGGMELEYADNGPGVPDGFDFRAQKTLGIQTIFLIVERQLGGSVAFEGGGGVSCRICLADKPRGKKTWGTSAGNSDICKGGRIND